MPEIKDTVEDRLDRIEQTLEDLKEGQDRIEEAIANVSLPGSDYSVFERED
jgi:hypothetical protein